MSWNGSNNATPTAGKRPAASHSSLNTQRSSLRHGLLAGLLVVALGGAAVWWFLGRGGGPGTDRPTGDVGKKGTIAEATPAVVTNKVAEAEAKPKVYSEMSREEKIKYWRDKYGDNLPANIKPVVYYLENPPKKTYHPNEPKHKFLKHRSERTIADMLVVKPGTLLLRQPHFDERFDEDFQSAAIDKIEIKDDDSEEVREIKKAVQETKKELIERVKAGEKASDIMNAEAKALYELGMYRLNLENEVSKVKCNPDMSDDDVRDMVEAANAMLKAKGAEPLRSPNFMYRQTMLAIAAERRKKAEAQKQNKGE